MRIAESIEIGREIEDVWRFASDRANDPAWCPKVKQVDRVAPERWRVVHKPVPLRPPAMLLVEQVLAEPPHHLRLRQEDAASVFEIEYRLEPVPAGTRFTQVSDFRWKRLPRILRGIFDFGVRRDVRRQLRELKRALERRAAERSGT
jgi:hypothetical protein